MGMRCRVALSRNRERILIARYYEKSKSLNLFACLEEVGAFVTLNFSLCQSIILKLPGLPVPIFRMLVWGLGRYSMGIRRKGQGKARSRSRPPQPIFDVSKRAWQDLPCRKGVVQ